MEERLSLLGGGGRYLNLFAAMKIGGFADPSIIFKAICDGEIEVNKKLLYGGDPAHERSWIQIETRSFIRWLEHRGHLSTQRVYTGIGDLSRHQETLFGFTRHDIHELKSSIDRLSFDIEALAALIFENLRVKKPTKGRRVRRRKGV